MNLTNKLITDNFQCPNPIYSENNMKLPYSACINRQIHKSEYGKLSYPECASCLYGKEIRRYFKGYKPIKNKVVRANKNVTSTRLRKGESLFSPHCIVKSKQTLDELIHRSKAISK
jgi:hypothetical protein